MQSPLDPRLLELFSKEFAPRRILIADDSISWSDALADACKKAGHEVLLHTYYVDEALRFIHNLYQGGRKNVLDVVLLDQTLIRRPKSTEMRMDGGLQIATLLHKLDFTVGIFSTSSDYWEENIPADGENKLYSHTMPHRLYAEAARHNASQNGILYSQSTPHIDYRGWRPKRGPDLQAVGITHDVDQLAQFVGRWRYTGENTRAIREMERFIVDMRQDGGGFGRRR